MKHCYKVEILVWNPFALNNSICGLTKMVVPSSPITTAFRLVRHHVFLMLYLEGPQDLSRVSVHHLRRFVPLWTQSFQSKLYKHVPVHQANYLVVMQHNALAVSILQPVSFMCRIFSEASWLNLHLTWCDRSQSLSLSCSKPVLMLAWSEPPCSLSVQLFPPTGKISWYHPFPQFGSGKCYAGACCPAMVPVFFSIGFLPPEVFT